MWFPPALICHQQIYISIKGEYTADFHRAGTISLSLAEVPGEPLETFDYSGGMYHGGHAAAWSHKTSKTVAFTVSHTQSIYTPETEPLLVFSLGECVRLPVWGGVGHSWAVCAWRASSFPGPICDSGSEALCSSASVRPRVTALLVLPGGQGAAVAGEHVTASILSCKTFIHMFLLGMSGKLILKHWHIELILLWSNHSYLPSLLFFCIIQ